MSKEKVSEEEVKDVINEAEGSENTEKKKISIDIKNILVLFLDYCAIILAYLLSLMFLSEVDFYLASLTYLNSVIAITPFYALGVIVIFFVVGLYPDHYSRVGVREARRLLFVTAFSTVVYFFMVENMGEHFPSIFYVLGGLIQFMFTLGTRFFYRLTHPDKDFGTLPE